MCQKSFVLTTANRESQWDNKNGVKPDIDIQSYGLAYVFCFVWFAHCDIKFTIWHNFLFILDLAQICTCFKMFSATPASCYSGDLEKGSRGAGSSQEWRTARLILPCCPVLGTSCMRDSMPGILTSSAQFGMIFFCFFADCKIKLRAWRNLCFRLCALSYYDIKIPVVMLLVILVVFVLFLCIVIPSAQLGNIFFA